MIEIHTFKATDILQYELKIRQLVREGYRLTERNGLIPKSFALRNTGENNMIYIEKSIDCPRQILFNLGVS